jgi:ubiquitin-protein ligase
MSMVRLRRLQADFERLRDYVTRHPRLQLIQAEGSPPERYQIEFRVRSLRQKDGQLETVASHLVEIALPRDYPRVPPLCRMLTPVFHPNIAPHAICIGDHWSAGESLQALVARIGEILAYQSYNTKSPLNGEAARWIDGNIDRLPLDDVSMSVEEPGPPPPPLAQPPAQIAMTAAPPAEVFELQCPACSAQLRLRQRPTSPRLRCPRCKAVFEAPAP